MRRRLTAAILLACLAAAVPAATSAAPTGDAPPVSPILTGPPTTPVPAGFFGIAPQTVLTDADARRMTAGGIESVRLPVAWSAIQPTAKGGYDWSSLDQAVAVASRHGLKVLPFLYGTPRWLAGKPTTLPIDSGRERAAWTAFLQAAVARYGPGGTFWAAPTPEPEPGPVQYEPGIPYAPAAPGKPATPPKLPLPHPIPIRTWQIWNEPNFFYFAYPVSPSRYAKLVKISSQAIKATDPRAKVILAGLFGKPTARGARGMSAADFLGALYRVPGIKNSFDGIALHPYAVDTATLEDLVEGIHDVMVENHDRVGLYVTEMGWGSQNDFNQVAFEQGPGGQVRELRAAYTYLIDNQRRLNLRQVYWFSWKDTPGACNFCDSVGLFRAGPSFQPKPAWHTFVALARQARQP
jgi:polysaccharide biosynthesis protein PslG